MNCKPVLNDEERLVSPGKGLLEDAAICSVEPLRQACESLSSRSLLDTWLAPLWYMEEELMVLSIAFLMLVQGNRYFL